MESLTWLTKGRLAGGAKCTRLCQLTNASKSSATNLISFPEKSSREIGRRNVDIKLVGMCGKIHDGVSVAKVSGGTSRRDILLRQQFPPYRVHSPIPSRTTRRGFSYPSRRPQVLLGKHLGSVHIGA